LALLTPTTPKTVEAWQRLRKLAPKVRDMTKPERDAMIGEAVNRLPNL